MKVLFADSEVTAQVAVDAFDAGRAAALRDAALEALTGSLRGELRSMGLDRDERAAATRTFALWLVARANSVEEESDESA